jgi:hemoglobin
MRAVGARPLLRCPAGDFYSRAFRDDLLGPVFVDVAHMDLDAHLPVMCDFWETALLSAGTYRGNALRPHQRLHTLARLTPTHFTRWLRLWRSTIDDRHAGPKADQAKIQAARIAGAMSRRITGEMAPLADWQGLARAEHG